MKVFLHTRAQITNLSSEKDSYGWVKGENKEAISIELSNPEDFAFNDPVMIILNSDRASTKFESTYRGTCEGISLFALPNLIRIDPPVEAGRRKIKIKSCSFETSMGTQPADVVDVSGTGIGIKTAESLESDSVLDFELHTEFGMVRLKGRVIYSRFQDEAFRSGVAIEGINRIDQARWNQLLAS